jgi:peptide/nickel transport system substrate-binding protein
MIMIKKVLEPAERQAIAMAALTGVDRRSFLKIAGGAMALTALEGTVGANAQSTAPKALVVAAPATPLTGDLEGPELADVQSQSTIMGCYDGLLEFRFKDYPDGHREAISGEFQPRLAEKWEQPNETTWRFTLVKGVKSEYGNEFTSADIEYLWNVYGPGRKNLADFFKNKIAKIVSVKAVDKYTVDFSTDGPAPMFLQVMTTAWSRPFDTTELKKHQTEADPYGAQWLNRHTAGYGPYRIAAWEPGVSFILERRPDYYGASPYLDKVTWLEVPDPSNRLSLLQSGSVGAARSLQFDDLKIVSQSNQLRVQSAEGNFGLYLLLHYDTKPFDDVRVRQAIAYAIPYDEIISKVYAGFATPLKSVEVPAYEGYTDKYWVYATNLEKAKQLIAEAGAKGTTVEVSYTAANPQHEAVAIAIQTAAAQIGINLVPRKMPAAAFTAAAITSSLPALLHDTYAWVVPTTGYDLALSKVPGSNDHVHYRSPRIQELAKLLAGEADLKKRLALADEAQKIMMNDLPWIPICNEGQHEAFTKALTGLTWVPHGVFLTQYLVPSSS